MLKVLMKLKGLETPLLEGRHGREHAQRGEGRAVQQSHVEGRERRLGNPGVQDHVHEHRRGRRQEKAQRQEAERVREGHVTAGREVQKLGRVQQRQRGQEVAVRVVLVHRHQLEHLVRQRGVVKHARPVRPARKQDALLAVVDQHREPVARGVVAVGGGQRGLVGREQHARQRKAPRHLHEHIVGRKVEVRVQPSG